MASVDASGAGVIVGEDGLDDDMSLAEVLRPPSGAQGVHSHQNLQSCHEHSFYRRALSTRYEMCLFESPCLACVGPLSLGRFLSRHLPRIPHLILASFR
jgi:hypothetical protein